MPPNRPDSEPSPKRSPRWIGSALVGTVTLVLVGLLIAFVTRAVQQPLPADEVGPLSPAAETQ